MLHYFAGGCGHDINKFLRDDLQAFLEPIDIIPILLIHTSRHGMEVVPDRLETKRIPELY